MPIYSILGDFQHTFLANICTSLVISFKLDELREN